MPSYRQLLCSCLFGALLPSLMAVEPIAVAGKIVKTNDLYCVAFFRCKAFAMGILWRFCRGRIWACEQINQ